MFIRTDEIILGDGVSVDWCPATSARQFYISVSPKN